MEENKTAFKNWLSNNTNNKTDKNLIIRNLNVLSILSETNIYQVTDANKNTVKKAIDKVKKFADKELIEKFEKATKLYLKMLEEVKH